MSLRRPGACLEGQLYGSSSVANLVHPILRGLEPPEPSTVVFRRPPLLITFGTKRHSVASRQTPLP